MRPGQPDAVKANLGRPAIHLQLKSNNEALAPNETTPQATNNTDLITQPRSASDRLPLQPGRSPAISNQITPPAAPPTVWPSPSHLPALAELPTYAAVFNQNKQKLFAGGRRQTKLPGCSREAPGQTDDPGAKHTIRVGAASFISRGRSSKQPPPRSRLLQSATSFDGSQLFRVGAFCHTTSRFRHYTR